MGEDDFPIVNLVLGGWPSTKQTIAGSPAAVEVPSRHLEVAHAWIVGPCGARGTSPRGRPCCLPQRAVGDRRGIDERGSLPRSDGVIALQH